MVCKKGSRRDEFIELILNNMPLTKREVEIMKMLYGVGCESSTLKEVGEKFNVSRERILQIEHKVLRRAKNEPCKLIKY